VVIAFIDMKKQVYKIELIVEWDNEEKISLKKIAKAKPYTVDITPIDLEDEQYKWLKQLKAHR
tara:strand:+ start:205 stop:393 length:189 start_codon:yes stop_codon:yes gene_type:complete